MKVTCLSGLLFIVSSCAHQKQTSKALPTGPDGHVKTKIFEGITHSLPNEYKERSLYMMAMDHSLKGEFEESLEYWKELFDKNSQDTLIRKNYGLDLLRAGRIEESIQIFEPLKIESSILKDPQFALILASAFLSLYSEDKIKDENKNYYKRGLDIYKTISLSNSSFRSSACILWSKAKASFDDYSGALKILKECLNHKNNPMEKMEILFNLGRYSEELSQLEKAKEYYSKASLLSDSNPTPLIYLAKVNEKLGLTHLSIQEYEKYLNIYPSDKIILSKLLSLLFQLKDKSKNINEKIFFYMEKLSGLDEEDLNLMIQLGVHYLENKQFDQSIKKFEKVLQKIPNSQKVIFYLGYIYQLKNELDQSIHYLEQIPKDSDLYPQAILTLAQAKITKLSQTLKTPQEIEGYLDLLIKENPALEIDFLVMKASTLELYDQVEKSLEILEDIVHKRGERSTPYLYYLASLYDKNKKFDNSYTLIEEILKSEPENAHALNFLGYSLLEQGKDLEKSFAYIKRAISLLPKDGFIRDSLGWYYYKTKQYNLALKELQLALVDSNGDWVISKHLGLTYKSLEKKEMAYACFKDALKNINGLKEKEEIEALIEELKNNLTLVGHVDNSKINIVCQ